MEGVKFFGKSDGAEIAAHEGEGSKKKPSFIFFESGYIAEDFVIYFIGNAGELFVAVTTFRCYAGNSVSVPGGW